MVVDDLQVLRVGTLKHVKKESSNIARDFLELLEGKCSLPVSTEKLIFVTRSKEVKRTLVHNVNRMASAHRSSARNLGVDFSAGARVKTTVQTRRCGKVKVAARRLCRLRVGFRASAHLVKSNFKPSAGRGEWSFQN